MNTVNNARSRQSREKIRCALLSLLEHQELTEITISQLCLKARVNRSTFYAHYDGLWDVVEELEQEMDQALLDQFHWVESAQSAILDRRSLLILTQQIQQHPAFYRARMNNPSLTARKMDVGLSYIMEHIILPYASSVSSHPLLHYYVAFGKAGILEVIQLWLSHNCAEPAEQIAQMLYDLCFLKLLPLAPAASAGR